MRIVFMGTPDFAVPSLQKLSQSRHAVVGVVTVPDKPRGRGQKLLPSAAKREASLLDLPVYQPEQLSDQDFLDAMRSLEPDLMVVVAFRILPESCYTIPTHGAINLHASLLPKFRGAAPIQRAIMNGESETGVTTFFLKPSVDTGDMLVQESIAIAPDENAGSVHDRLAELGADVVLRTVNGIDDGTLKPVPQDDSKASPAPKITKDDCRIDWHQPVMDVHNQIRALSPYPGAFTRWNDLQLKVYAGEIVRQEADADTAEPGTVVLTGDDKIDVQCAPGIYGITELQPQGKRRMSAKDFLNGNPLAERERLS